METWALPSRRDLGRALHSTAGTLRLLLILEKPLAGFELNGVHTAGKVVGKDGILLETRTGLGSLSKQFQEHRNRRVN